MNPNLRENDHRTGPLAERAGDRPNSVSLVAVGDLVFTGPFARDPVGTVDRLPADLRAALDGDIVLANLECAMAEAVPRAVGRAEVPLVTAPLASVDGLKRLNVSVVSLANNHVFDGGPAGVAQTTEALDRGGILHFGAGLDYAAASRPAVVERNGLRVAFLGFCGCEVAGGNKPGTLLLDCASTRKLIRRTRDRCDFLVLYFHEGIEAFNYPTRAAMHACRRAVEAGADLVVGTHPHTIQGIEYHRGVPIVYSLGNFIMPLFSGEAYDRWHAQTALTRLGVPFERETITRALILQCVLSPGRPAAVRAIPIVVEESGLPRLPAGDEARRATAFLESICEAFGRPDDPVWAQRDRLERMVRRLHRENVSWRYVLRNLTRLRPRHVIAYLRSFT